MDQKMIHFLLSEPAIEQQPFPSNNSDALDKYDSLFF